MLKVYSFDGAVSKGDISKLPKSPTWIRIVDPDMEKINLLSKYTAIPSEELKESIEEEERPKVSTGKYLEIIYRAPYIVSGELSTLPIYFYLFEDRLVTIEKKPLKFFDQVDSSFSRNSSKFLFRRGFPYFIFHIIDKVNDEFLYQIDKIASRIDLYENFSKKELDIKDIEKVYDQSIALSFFNQALIANVEVLNSLKKGYFKLLKNPDKELFEELYYNVLQILDTEKIQREAVTNLINVHSIITSTRLNQFMKRLTALALIVTIPAGISGLYGMNFDHIPLSHHPYGFYITTMLILLFTFSIYYLFNKIKWI